MKQKKLRHPCVGRCYDCDPVKELCNGCGLTLDERSNWFMMPRTKKKAILARLKKERGGNPAG